MKKILLYAFAGMLFMHSAMAMPRFDADVSVDITAGTVNEAKKKAISKAMREGLSEIVSSISTEASVKEINKLNDNQLEHFITGVMVLMEKTSDVRYMADFRISVDENLLKSYMAENNMPIILRAEQQVLVLPIIEKEDGTIYVWEEDNFWRQAFMEKKNLRRGNMNIRIMEKNLGNIATVKANRLFDLADGEFKELLNFNHAEVLYVVKYAEKEGKVFIKEYPSGKTQETNIVADKLGETADNTLALFKSGQRAAVESTPANIMPERIDVVYSYTSLSEWIALKKLLEDNPQAQNIKLISMANGKVHFNFQYSGVIEKLQGMLETNGYKMRQEGEHYVIY